MDRNDRNDRSNNQQTSRDGGDHTVTIVGRSTPEFEKNLANFRLWQEEQRAQRDRR